MSLQISSRYADICSGIEHQELKELCMGGYVWNYAREQLFKEIEDAGKNPKMYMESMGWNVEESVPDLPELEECIDLEIAFDTDDVKEVTEALAQAADEALRTDKAKDIFEALYLGSFSGKVNDAITNIVAERLLEAINTCREKIKT